MNRILPLLALAAIAAAPLAARAEAPKGFKPLFDGKTLEGFQQNNGTAAYKVEDGTILGTTSEGSPNSFLCTKKPYGNFELHFEVKVDDALNSGVQIRSATKGGTPDGRVHGPQVEIATNGSAGFVWGEALGTGWLSDDPGDKEKAKAFKKGEWNKYRVVADGKHIRTWVNGIAISDFQENETGMSKGFIGLQVHGIKKGTGPYQVRWRNLYIKELGSE